MADARDATPDAGERRGRQRFLWVLSGLLGLSLLVPTSELQYEFFSITRGAGPRLVATSCQIPAEFLAPRIKAVSRDIARRFHVAQSAALSITRAAFTASLERGIDPTLVLAVAAVESKFKPGAVNPVTGAKGLMQVLPKWHPDEVMSVGGEPSLLLIAPNISVGAAILADYLDKERGDLTDALSHYLGTAGAETYEKRVRAERAHLTQILKTS
jgi:soluble lytic murein transglycosylase-like protein